jgi:multidrug transporter EmrE-like cation transporter
MDAPKIVSGFRLLTASLLVSVGGAVCVLALPRPENNLDSLLSSLAFAAWVAGGVAFYVMLGVLASRLNRSPIVWVGAAFIFTPIGPLVAYFRMRSLIAKTLTQDYVAPAA